MIVVDTSAVVDALAGRPWNRELVDRLSNDGDLHAPHLVDVEFQHALRRLIRRRLLTQGEASEIRRDFAALVIVRYPHQPFADRIWALGENLTPYDAVFVALAEALQAPLVTVDARLASAPGHQASVEVYAD